MLFGFVLLMIFKVPFLPVILIFAYLRTCYLTPVNPGSKDSYVIISPDSLDPEGTSDVGQYPQIKGTPINDVSQTGSSTISISGTINGKVGADKSAIQKRYDKLQRWFDF